jgi:hypothetical protein
LLDKTSEKTVEVNVLHDLATCLERNNFKITIVAPTQNEELDLGFDEIFSDLPSGKILALQFKRPEERNNIEANFHISIPQLRTLRHNFPNRNEAFYLFSPFPTIDQFRNARQNLLESSSIVEIHDGALNTHTRQQSRTVVVNMTNPIRSKVTDHGSFSHITQIQRASELCPGINEQRWGRKFNNPSKDKDENGSNDRDNGSDEGSSITKTSRRGRKGKKKTESSNSGIYFIHIQNNSENK